MTLGNRIKEQRNRLGLSQERIAELIGTSRQAVTKWESDKSIPCMENLITLAEIFDTPLDKLINGANIDIVDKPIIEPATFKGKIGIWWIFLIIIINLFLAYVFVISTETWAYILVAGIAVILNPFMAVITLINYVVLSDKMLIHFGLSKTYVEYKDIISIEKTNSPLAGSALSFDRLLINTGSGKLIISVKSKTDFINLLIKHNERIKVV